MSASMILWWLFLVTRRLRAFWSVLCGVCPFLYFFILPWCRRASLLGGQRC